jgi:hypothetical protein
MLRRPRYLPAVAFALLALAFVGLWVRSYDYLESMRMPLGRRTLAGTSYDGVIGTVWGEEPPSPDLHKWSFESLHASSFSPRPRRSQVGPLGFTALHGPNKFGVMFPHWFLAAASLSFAALLAFKPITRFTARGLLITTTLFAAVLGLAVYAA